MWSSKKLFATAVKTASDPRRATLKHLPYEMGSLEPIMSGLLLDYHYGKHHRTYVTNLNNLLEKQAELTAKGDLLGSVQLTGLVAFNSGGHYNHEFFWDSLCPQADSELPSSGDLHEAITETWGSLDEFIKEFSRKTAGIQGSGWGWLCYNVKTGNLSFRATYNQDMIRDVFPEHRPLLNIDIWEHAYYLDYKNGRP